MTIKMIGAVACLGAAFSFGQSMETVKVNLPVDAKVGKVSLPAGQYSIHEVSNSVLEITSDARKGVSTFVEVFPVVAAHTADQSKVVLRMENNAYQIQSIWLEGQDMGFELTTAAE
jgi:hypothetical protein